MRRIYQCGNGCVKAQMREFALDFAKRFLRPIEARSFFEKCVDTPSGSPGVPAVPRLAIGLAPVIPGCHMRRCVPQKMNVPRLVETATSGPMPIQYRRSIRVGIGVTVGLGPGPCGVDPYTVWNGAAETVPIETSVPWRFHGTVWRWRHGTGRKPRDSYTLQGLACHLASFQCTMGRPGTGA